MKRLVLFILIFVSGCGESPLLNHVNEKRHGMGSLIQDQTAIYSIGSEYSFSLNWTEGPKMGVSRFVLHLWKNDQGTFEGPYQDLPGILAISIFMPAMGHGSSPVKITRVNPGEYIVSEINFFMGGTWEVKFQMKENGQVHDETVLPYNL